MADKPVSIWRCDGCSNIYKSYIALSEPPFHRCPDYRSVHIRKYTLVEGQAPFDPPKKKDKG